MTIPLSGSGGLFTRTGHLGGIIGVNTSLANLDLNSYRGTTMPAKITQILNDYAASPDDRLLVDNLLSGALWPWQGAQNAFLTAISTLLSNTIIQMAQQDTPLPAQNIVNALNLLISQMVTAVASVNSSVPSLGSQTAVGSPNGNPIIVGSVKDANGLALQYCFPETMTFTCTRDSQTGGTVLNQEQMTITSPAPISMSSQGGNGPLSWPWPQGSGISVVQNLIDAAVNYSGNTAGGSVLVNGNFSTFTVPNQPDNWVVGAGIVGTNVLSSATAYYGAASLEFLGDGSTLQSISQQFGQNSGGTLYALQPNTQYAVQGWIQTPVAPAAGVLSIELANAATGGAIIADNAGNNNAISQSLTGLTSATWTSVKGTFRTPSVLPTNQFLRFRMTTAETSAKQLLLNRFALAPMAQFYPGGPFFAQFSNSNKVIKGDAWTLAIGQTYGLFQFLFDRCLNMRGLGLVIPNSGSPTISDSLIA